MAKICKLPKDSTYTANANIGGTTDTHSQILFHHESCATKALAGYQGPLEIGRVGLHRWELYYKQEDIF
jgi:hypothetical protein